MHICKLLDAKMVACHLTANNKKHALELLSQVMTTELDGTVTAQDIMQHLMNRERLGSTSIGHGVAIPHARLAEITQSRLALVTLKQAVDFGSSEQPPTDILCGLIVPEAATEQHLQILAQLAEIFSNAPLREQIRNSTEPDSIYRIMMAAHDI